MTATRAAPARLRIPDAENASLRIGGHEVQLTNLDKVFWPELGYTKRDLLQYYADVSPVLLPHLTDRAMVMKRYPNGIQGKWFFMKRTPSPRPEWLETCEITHKSNNVIAFPMVQDLAALLWVVNLGCIDLNPWYARCDDVDRPDYLHFDLDPVEGADFDRVRETALILRDALQSLGMKPLAKTSGSKGIHVYVPIVRRPVQKEVWRFAKALAKQLEKGFPELITAEYRVANRPRGRVLVDYNQNAWGHTLASVYSVRPNPRAAVSTPVTWDEVESGFAIDDYRMDNVPRRMGKLGDLWKPLLNPKGRFALDQSYELSVVDSGTAAGERVMAKKTTTRKKSSAGARPGKPAKTVQSPEAKLTEYRRKRDFSQTVEPEGGAAPALPTPQFVVQKHAASRLHYDLRLEHDGVMKSWAVPKGPSMDPSVKRLAMEVEDHPIEYNEFEGTIPRGEYGGGTVMLWDRGNYAYAGSNPDPEEGIRQGLKKGDFKFVLNGKRLKGSWALVRMRPDKSGKPQWLLIKHQDPYAEPGSDVAAEHQTSVATGRTMEEIAGGKGQVWHSNRAEQRDADRERSATGAKGNARKPGSSAYERLMARRSR